MRLIRGDEARLTDHELNEKYSVEKELGFLILFMWVLESRITMFIGFINDSFRNAFLVQSNKSFSRKFIE